MKAAVKGAFIFSRKPQNLFSMKKSALLLIALATMLSFSYAQEPGKPMPGQAAPQVNGTTGKQGDCAEPRPINPMMLKMKKDFIQENFVIESSKKEAFWNAYDEYNKEILAAHKAQREFRQKNNIPTKMSADSLSSLSDQAILSYYENNFATKNQLFRAEEKFFQKLKTILSPQQIAQYYILEKNFHKSASKMDKHTMKMEAKPMRMDYQPLDKNLQAVPQKPADPKH